MIYSILIKEKATWNHSCICLNCSNTYSNCHGIVHERLLGKDQGGNITQDQGEENGGMTEGQTDPTGEEDVDLGTGGA